MLRNYYRSQEERVQKERSRRSSIAGLLHQREHGEGEDAETFTPTYDDEDPDAVVPTNLGALGDADLQLYYQLVETTQAEPEQAPLYGMNAPQPAMATGGSASDSHLANLMQHILDDRKEGAAYRGRLSQKDCANLLGFVPSVVPDGRVLDGPKLLAWFNEAVSTWLPQEYWDVGSFAFNATKSLFKDAPELEASWEQATQGDTQVVLLKSQRRWREAWDLVAASIVAAHVGDRHMALRKKVKAPQQLLQHGDKTVAKTCTAHLEDVQAARVLGLWDHFATLKRDIIADAKSNNGYSVSMLGIDLTSPEGRAGHDHILNVLDKYIDRQRALELFGALRPEIQTFIENSPTGKKLLDTSAGDLTWEEVRTLATEFETREKSRDQDLNRHLKKLGVEVPKQGKGGRNAQSRSVGGKAKGSKGGKAKGSKGGKGNNRRTRRQGSSNDEAPADAGPLVAGKDGTTNAAIQ